MTDSKPKVEVVPPIPPFLNMQGMVQPVHIPQLEYGKFFLTRIRHNWELKHITIAREKESQIAEHQKNQQIHQIEMLIAMTTMMDRYQAEKSEFNSRTARATHDMEMMALEKQSKMLDNQLKLMQFNDEQLDFRLKEKDMKNVLSEGQDSSD